MDNVSYSRGKSMESAEHLFTRPDILIFDTAKKDRHNKKSYIFSSPKKVISAQHYNEVIPALQKIKKTSEDAWTAGFICYEAAYALEESLYHLQRKRNDTDLPLLWFGVYSHPAALDSHDIGDTLKGGGYGQTDDHVPEVTVSTDETAYIRNIRAIKRAIARGETYQVNFTFDTFFSSSLSTPELYKHLRAKQSTPYCAYFKNSKWEILSFSPELFFRCDGRKITVKPMKGTAARTSLSDDDQTARLLACDEKNRAENIMIVDLLRNDLGRISRPGKVKTTHLFDIEKHPTVYQMTSTVKGSMQNDKSFPEIVQALFPSGSVTGAPKIRTMQIIADLEKGSRGVYCGMMGYISPQGKSVFSVPIRTLQRKRGEKAWQYRVGSGIVWDSKSRKEWEECRSKISFLTRLTDEPFEIVETVLWKGRLVYLKQHIDRMRASARYFSYPWRDERLHRMIAGLQKRLTASSPCCVRFLLNEKGIFRREIQAKKVKEINRKIVLRPLSCRPDNIFLRHKTTYRPWYREAMNAIRSGTVFDHVFFNKDGYVTEGARSSVFIKKRSVLYTPPLAAGVLPGIQRKRLIQQGKCRVAKIRKNDLFTAKAIYCGNSVRGLVRVFL